MASRISFTLRIPGGGTRRGPDGGDLLAARLADVASRFAVAFRVALTEEVRRRVLPRIRARAPYRTGRLRSSIRLVASGGGVRIIAAFYGAFVGLRRIAREELETAWPMMVSSAANKARRAI